MSRQQTALFSVYHKTDGFLKFARELVTLGWRILSSGGTATFLKDHGIVVEDIAQYVGKPILGHRVVTLSREIHAALLATESEADQAELDALNIPRIDLVYVTFYPIGELVDRQNVTLAMILEKTDIGGPTLLRSAAKGRRLAVSLESQIPKVLEFIRKRNETSADECDAVISALASVAEFRVSEYCNMSAALQADEAARIWNWDRASCLADWGGLE